MKPNTYAVNGLPRSMPHLDGAKTKLHPSPGQKLCMHEAAAFVLDVPGSELVIGIFRAASDAEAREIEHASRTPFLHAWAEYRGLVWSPTAMVSCPPAAYYRANGATDIRRIKRPQLLQVARQIGLSRHLRLGVPTKDGASVGRSLLAAAGIEHRIGSNGALLPA